MLTLFQIECTTYIAIFSWVYVNILTDEDMILWWWYKLLSRIKNTYILKPILLCEYCIAGQIALWSFFFFPYNILSHICYISLTIFLVHLIKLIDLRNYN